MICFDIFTESVFYARPHPNLLPQGEGMAIVRLGFDHDCSAIPISGFSKHRRMILPLLGGEGWGEGERSDKFPVANHGRIS